MQKNKTDDFSLFRLCTKRHSAAALFCTCLSVRLFVSLLIDLCICLSVCVLVFPSVCCSICLFVCCSFHLERLSFVCAESALLVSSYYDSPTKSLFGTYAKTNFSLDTETCTIQLQKVFEKFEHSREINQQIGKKNLS